jgi:plastocyanin
MKMLERAYLPRTLNIKVGTEVIWSNTACMGGCTVTFPGLSLDSGPMAIGATFKHTFSEAGSFAFHCRLDPDEMKGTIIVTD